MEEKERVEIERANNGFIVRNYYWEDSTEDGKKIIGCDTEVIEDDEDDRNKLLAKLLYKVAELEGYSYDKWGKENLSIKFNEKGRKV